MPDVAIVGAGVAGLCLAAELAGRGLSVTVVDRRYPGGGNTTRNVGRVRRVQLTPELTALAVAAHEKWHRLEQLTGGRNALVYPTRYAWVLYDDDERERLATLEPMWRELDARAGIDGAAALKAVPVLAGGEVPVGAVLGEAAIVHHDAALFGLLQACREAGVEVRPNVRATGLDIAAGRVAGLETDGGTIAATIRPRTPPAPRRRASPAGTRDRASDDARAPRGAGVPAVVAVHDARGHVLPAARGLVQPDAPRRAGSRVDDPAEARGLPQGLDARLPAADGWRCCCGRRRWGWAACT